MNNSKAFSGFLLGLIAGGLIGLFLFSRAKGQKTASVDHNSLESAKRMKPITENIVAGREAARRRRSELGLG